MTDRNPSRGRPKRDRRFHLEEVPTDRRDLRKLALAVLAIARARVVEDVPEPPHHVADDGNTEPAP